MVSPLMVEFWRTYKLFKFCYKFWRSHKFWRNYKVPVVMSWEQSQACHSVTSTIIVWSAVLLTQKCYICNQSLLCSVLPTESISNEWLDSQPRSLSMLFQPVLREKAHLMSNTLRNECVAFDGVGWHQHVRQAVTIMAQCRIGCPTMQ